MEITVFKLFLELYTWCIAVYQALRARGLAACAACHVPWPEEGQKRSPLRKQPATSLPLKSPHRSAALLPRSSQSTPRWPRKRKRQPQSTCWPVTRRAAADSATRVPGKKRAPNRLIVDDSSKDDNSVRPRTCAHMDNGLTLRAQNAGRRAFHGQDGGP